VRRISWHSSWPIVAAAVLVALLAVLATLQYRWLGAVSDAERERLRASLRARAADLSDDFDRELTRAYMAFQFDPLVFEKDPAATLAAAYARAQSASAAGGSVQAVYVIDAQNLAAGAPQRLDPATGTLAPAEWPASLDTWRSRVAVHLGSLHSVVVPPMFMADAIEADAPALIIPVPRFKRIEDGGHLIVTGDPGSLARAIIVMLDAERLIGQLLASLVARHFGAAESEYVVTVVSRDDPMKVIFTSEQSAAAAPVTPQNADVTTGLFDLRLDEMNRLATLPPEPGKNLVLKDRVAIAIVRRASGAEGARVLMSGGERQGAWQVLVRSRQGSLETLVASSRRRNLAIGLGVLGLLAVSFVFVIGSAQRQRRLARQQMEFVASVSHELRTPLAVIRSAGDNLADGVVLDEDQVRKYGSLIRTEGRRLTDMVERVMEFAGITARARATSVRARADVDLSRVIRDAVAGVDAEARERGVAISVDEGGSVPAIVGDADTLRSAVQNIVGNSVKYTPSGGTVLVRVEAGDRDVRIVTVDRGIGIDPADLPRVFKPFYRGKRAVDLQIRGSGVGLSIVRHVVDAHGGSVHIDSVAGEGTVVTVTLPVVGGAVPAAVAEADAS